MIEYYDGTVFNAGCDAIVNAINTDGFMGKGIALEFALRFPGLLEHYQEGCKSGDIRVNKVDFFLEAEKKIINFPTKMHFRFPSQLSWIEGGLKDFVSCYRKKGITSVAFPRLGCANGGLLWEQVKPLMEKYLANIDIPVFICLDSLPYAEGKEKEMVDLFNQSSVEELATHIRMSSKQKINLRENQPITRFWKIGDIEGIGIETYRKLFIYFYESPGIQMTIFGEQCK